MKLRNKKTGEIVDTLCEDITKGITLFIDHHDGSQTTEYYNSLAELCEEWEDYEEPNIYWYITSLGEVVHRGFSLKKWGKYDDDRKQMGNYFSTKEEAEKAVEKLRALKKLKEKGFKFTGWEESPSEDDFDTIFFITKNRAMDVETQDYLTLLFGGEK